MCRHWNVFWAGLALCVIFWGIAPLNSSLLTTQHVTRAVETSFKPLKKLIPFDNQKASVSSAFLYISDSVTWLGEKVHSFMTKELIAIPFEPASNGKGQDHFAQGNESWTAQTRAYQTELLCTPAEINLKNCSEGAYYQFSTDRCTYFGYPIPTSNGTRNMIYFGFGNNHSISGSFLFDKQKCEDPNLFLAIWAKSHNAHNRSDELDLNALYCKPSYRY